MIPPSPFLSCRPAGDRPFIRQGHRRIQKQVHSVLSYVFTGRSGDHDFLENARTSSTPDWLPHDV